MLATLQLYRTLKCECRTALGSTCYTCLNSRLLLVCPRCNHAVIGAFSDLCARCHFKGQVTPAHNGVTC